MHFKEENRSKVRQDEERGEGSDSSFTDLFPNGNRNLRVHREHKLFDSLQGDRMVVTVEVTH